MLVWVSEYEKSPYIVEVPSSACHFCRNWGRLMLSSIPVFPSSSWVVGFHCSTRGPSTLTACPMSGLWYGSRAVQWPANSATLKIIAIVSSLSQLIVSSTTLGMLSLLTRTLRNHVTKYFSSFEVLEQVTVLKTIGSHESSWIPFVNSYSKGPCLPLRKRCWVSVC